MPPIYILIDRENALASSGATVVLFSFILVLGRAFHFGIVIEYVLFVAAGLFTTYLVNLSRPLK